MTSDYPQAAELANQVMATKIRREVIDAGHFPSLASAAAFEITARERHHLPRSIPELDYFAYVRYPDELSLWWAVDEQHRQVPKDQQSDPEAGRFPAPREESTVADIAAHNPLDRLKADPDTFGPDQHIIDTWADAEGGEQFVAELDDMSLREARALAELAVSVANEHDRRANRAHRVAAAVRERLVDLSGYREAASQGVTEAVSRGR